MRIAVLLGTMRHNGTPGNLLDSQDPNVFLMERLLKATRKYDELFCFSENSAASDVTERIISTFKRLRGKSIEEALFYYAGRIDFSKNEFCYVTTHFDKGTRRPVLIENSEVDDWLRILQPSFAAKIIDGCHSGVTAETERRCVENCLRKAEGNLRRSCLIFFSKQDQVPYEENRLSRLTGTFLEAIRNHRGEEITYKDIADFISKQFRPGPNGNGTPFFISQLSFEEVFCQMTPEVRGAAEQRDLVWTPFAEPSDLALEQIVRKDSERYLGEKKVMGILEQLRERISGYTYPPAFNRLYKVHHSFQDCLLGGVPKQREIGVWLAQNPHEHFAEAVFEKEISQENSKLPSVGEKGENGGEHSHGRPIKGYKLTANSPFNQIQIKAEARYPNIPWFNCTLLFVFSKANIRFFYFYTNYVDKSWNVRELNADVEWQTVELGLSNTEDLFNHIGRIQDEFAKSIVRQIRKKFGFREGKKDRETETVFQLVNGAASFDSQHDPSPLDDILLALAQESERYGDEETINCTPAFIKDD